MITLAQILNPLTAGSIADWWTRWNFREPGSSTIAGQTDWLFFWIFAISTFFFVLLMVLMVWFTWKYRKRAGAVPARSPSHNTVLELSWSVIPTIILVWMFFEGFWGYANAVVAPAHSEEIVVTGQRWSWSVLYKNGAGSGETVTDRGMRRDEIGMRQGVQEAPVIVVPQERPISLRMSSKDVIHSFWIPDFRVKFDVFPNRYTSLWFTAHKIDPAKAEKGKTKKGHEYLYEDHWVFCAEYCGDNHSEMYAVVRVVDETAYRAILDEWATPTGALWEQGRFYWKSKGCNSCHSVDGSANVGPTWKDLYGHKVDFTDGSSLGEQDMKGTAFANYVRESVYTPSKRIVAGFPNSMPGQQGVINEEVLVRLTEYMKYLSAEGKAEIEAATGGSAAGATGTTGPTGATGATGAPAGTGK